MLQTVVGQSNREANPALDEVFQKLNRLEVGQPIGDFDPIDQAVAAARADDRIRSELESRLLLVLQGDATDLAKDYACRQLAIVGSDAALPVLAKLLRDPRLSYMARYALEGIGSPAVRETLREMLAHTEHSQQIGVVISLGRLSDAKAVVPIAALLDEEDEEHREAALVALGRIGSVAAAEAIAQFRDRAPESLRDNVASAQLAAAELLRQRMMFQQAEKIYRSLLSSNAPHVRAGAYRGLILINPDQVPAEICRGLASSEDWKREVAADCLLDLDEPDHISAVARAVADLPSAGKIAALVSLRGHIDGAIRRAALQSLDQPETAVKKAAISALVSSGTAEDVWRLASLASGTEDATIGNAARDTLRLMPGKDVDRAFSGWMVRADELPPALVRCALDRRSPVFVPAFLRAAESPRADTRKEAFSALEVMAEADDVGALVALLCKTPPGDEREAAGRAVWISCQRIAEPSQRARPLLAAMKDGDAAARCAILPTLARIGGGQALAAVDGAMQSDDPDLRDAGYRALANWPDASVADRLLEIATSSSSATYRVWALRAYARVVALPSERPPDATFKMLREAMSLATRSDDRELIVSRMATVRAPEALELLLSLIDDSELRVAATDAVFASAKGLSQSHPQQARAALERVQPMITDPAILQQIPRVLRDIEARIRK